MPDETGNYRSASLPIDQHGKEAPVFAAMQADACLEKGDLDVSAQPHGPIHSQCQRATPNTSGSSLNREIM